MVIRWYQSGTLVHFSWSKNALMDLCCILQARTLVFGQILYLSVFSFCTSSCQRGDGSCPAFPAPQAAKEGARPGAWLAGAERWLAAIHITS